MSGYRETDVAFAERPKRNRVRCLNCGMVLESLHLHDFQMCKCDNYTFTDGGLDYQRVGGVDLSLIKVVGDDEE